MFVVVILSRHRRRLVDSLHAPLILCYAAFQVYWLEIQATHREVWLAASVTKPFK